MSAVSVTTTATLIPDSWIEVYNAGPSDAYFSSLAAVTTATGVPLKVGGSLTRFVRAELGVLYMITASGTADIRYYSDSFSAA